MIEFKQRQAKISQQNFPNRIVYRTKISYIVQSKLNKPMMREARATPKMTKNQVSVKTPTSAAPEPLSIPKIPSVIAKAVPSIVRINPISKYTDRLKSSSSTEIEKKSTLVFFQFQNL